MMHRTAIEIVQLFAYEGPNIFGPQPGVLLRVRCDKDRSKQIKAALKDGAQFIGMIMAYLDVSATPDSSGVVISASFTTATPAIGAALAEAIVEGISAMAAREQQPPTTDDEDEDEPEEEANAPLFALQQRMRREGLKLSALQLVAEAQTRSLPLLRLPDGWLQFGYGAHSWRFDLAALPDQRLVELEGGINEAQTVQPPWEEIGTIPLYAVTGEQQRGAAVRQVADNLRQKGYQVHELDNADYETTRALLADPRAQCAVVGLQTADILRRGIAFSTCTQAIITDMEGQQPAAAATAEEWVQALGVPMLVSGSPAVLNTTYPALASLAPYAPYGVVSPADKV